MRVFGATEIFIGILSYLDHFYVKLGIEVWDMFELDFVTKAEGKWIWKMNRD